MILFNYVCTYTIINYKTINLVLEYIDVLTSTQYQQNYLIL